MLIIGVDCATDERKTGVALGRYERGRVVVHQARACSEAEPAASVVTQWLTGHDAALLALDAPLGWPAALGDELARHQAGGVIATEKNRVFRRETDRFIQEHLGKTPLDVGADRIARTAHSALQLLESLRLRLKVALPLAWDPARVDAVSAIEVYPAATLRAHGIASSGYKHYSRTPRASSTRPAAWTRSTPTPRAASILPAAPRRSVSIPRARRTRPAAGTRSTAHR